VPETLSHWLPFPTSKTTLFRRGKEHLQCPDGDSRDTPSTTAINPAGAHAGRPAATYQPCFILQIPPLLSAPPKWRHPSSSQVSPQGESYKPIPTTSTQPHSLQLTSPPHPLQPPQTRTISEQASLHRHPSSCTNKLDQREWRPPP
jgi:hypothetical protein